MNLAVKGVSVLLLVFIIFFLHESAHVPDMIRSLQPGRLSLEALDSGSDVKLFRFIDPTEDAHKSAQTGHGGGSDSQP